MNLRHPILAFFLRLFWRKRYIIFESLPAFGDSSRKVYDEMVRRKLDKKYGFIWIDFENRQIPEEISKKCTIIHPEKNFYRYRLLRYFCAAFIGGSNTHVIPLPHKNKLTSFYIYHGSPIKDPHSYYFLPESIECAISASQEMSQFMAYVTNFPQDKIVGLGYPRNDDLFEHSLELGKLLETDAKQFVVWYPTFRQHKEGMFQTAGKNQVPLLHNVFVAKELNEYAKTKKILIVLKPHFVQDISIFESLHFSNIRLIDDNFFLANNISSYQFVGSCDALITDYSSVMYDFTLCNKPIALIWEDIDEYRKSPGIVPGIEKYLDCTHKVYNIDDMKRFLDVVASGSDPLSARLQQVKKQVNASDKPDNTERVTNFIMEQAKL